MEEIINMILINWKKIVGLLLGFVLACFFINYGFVKTVFVVFCTVLGYVIGSYDKNIDLKDWIVKKLSRGEEKE